MDTIPKYATDTCLFVNIDDVVLDESVAHELAELLHLVGGLTLDDHVSDKLLQLESPPVIACSRRQEPVSGEAG